MKIIFLVSLLVLHTTYAVPVTPSRKNPGPSFKSIARAGLVGALALLDPSQARPAFEPQDSEMANVHEQLAKLNADPKVRQLILANVDLDYSQDPRKTDALILAIKENNPEKVWEMSQHTSIDAWDSDGFTPLIHAVLLQHYGIVKILLYQGANVDLVSTSSLAPMYTPLMIALEMENAGIVDLLVKFGADMKPKNEEGNTAMDIAKQSSDRRLVRILAQKSRLPNRL